MITKVNIDRINLNLNNNSIYNIEFRMISGYLDTWIPINNILKGHSNNLKFPLIFFIREKVIFTGNAFSFTRINPPPFERDEIPQFDIGDTFSRICNSKKSYQAVLVEGEVIISVRMQMY